MTIRVQIFALIWFMLTMEKAFGAIPLALRFSDPLTNPVPRGPLWVAIHDLNGDGKLDIAATTTNGVSVLVGNGDGSFQTSVMYPAGLRPQFIAIGDVNKDHYPDLIVANGGFGATRGSISLLMGRGDGTFGGTNSYDAGVSPLSIGVGDFDRDGNIDLAVANTVDVALLMGNGDGTFREAKYRPAGGRPGLLAVADLNGDGQSDLIVANNSSNDVSVLLGNGDGTFQDQRLYVAGGSPSCVVVGDFNRDGVPDLAVSDIGSGEVSVLLGNSDGSFQQSRAYPVGIQPSSVVTADFNSDGFLDLALGHFGYASVSLLLGNGDGTFQDVIDFRSGPFPWGIASGDLDGNGQSDLVCGSVFGFNVSVLLNTSAATVDLALKRTGHGVTISWPFSSSKPVLESASRPDASSWIVEPENPQTNSNHLEVDLPFLTEPQRYFRLHNKSSL